MDRDKLINILNEYFGINSKDGTYAHWLTRCKEGFSVGTVTLDDFEEFTDENIGDLADYIIEYMLK